MLRVERDGAVAVWTLERPETKNALNWALIEALVTALDDASKDRSLRAVVLTGAGNAFVSGGDLRELRGVITPDETNKFADAGEELCRRIEDLPVPVIAAIPGPAYGGGAELALACDLRIADERARFSFKQVRMGITTAWGTVPRLLSIVGYSCAARLLYTGHEVGAGAARRMGLVDNVAEKGGAVAGALAWASDIVEGSPAAVAGMKTLLRAARAPSLAALRATERAHFVATWTGADHAEAMAAFFDRRRPTWK